MDIQANRVELVKALRSGDYKQTRGALRNGGRKAITLSYLVGFCCLGVACDIYRKITGKGKWIPDESGSFLFRDSTGFESLCLLPGEVGSFFGFSPNASYKDSYDEKTNALAIQNDRGVSFEDIANLIETKEFVENPAEPK